MNTMTKNMLVSTVRERRGGVLQPVGVMVGINDIADGIGCIRTGWSRCHLAPVNAPAEIPEQYIKYLSDEGKAAYRFAIKEYDKAVANSDVFNLEQGIAQACRSITNPTGTIPVGRNFAKKYARFQDRCKRYFKDVDWFCDNGVTSRINRVPSLPIMPNIFGMLDRMPAFDQVLNGLMGGKEELISFNGLGNLLGGKGKYDPKSIIDKVMRTCSDPHCSCHKEPKLPLSNIGNDTTKALEELKKMRVPAEIQRLANMLELLVGPVKIVDTHRL